MEKIRTGVEMTVINDGFFPEEDVPRLFERLFSGERSCHTLHEWKKPGKSAILGGPLWSIAGPEQEVAIF